MITDQGGITFLFQPILQSLNNANLLFQKSNIRQ